MMATPVSQILHLSGPQHLDHLAEMRQFGYVCRQLFADRSMSSTANISSSAERIALIVVSPCHQRIARL
jgi:hypothetical protein